MLYLKKVPMGSYIVCEEETARYSLDRISSITNGTLVNNGKAVKMIFTDSALRAEATFSNEKYEWQDFSDTGKVINHIKN